MTTLIIFNEELDDTTKIVGSLKDTAFLIKGVMQTFENEVKNKKEGFYHMIGATLGASLLGSMLSGKGAARGGDGVIRASKGGIRAGQDF